MIQTVLLIAISLSVVELSTCTQDSKWSLFENRFAKLDQPSELVATRHEEFWARNTRFVGQFNPIVYDKTGFKTALNHLPDETADESKRLRGYKQSNTDALKNHVNKRSTGYRTIKMKLTRRTNLVHKGAPAFKLEGNLKPRHKIDSLFLGEIGIGNPEQKLRVSFDTDSANVWVPSKKCTNCDGFSNLYDSKMSKTYKIDGQSIWDHYGIPLVEGFGSIDDLSVAGLTIKNQTFGEIVHYTERNEYVDAAEGVFGLSFDSRAVNRIKTPMRNMLDQGLISKSIVSMYLNPNQTASPGGGIIFGGIEESLLSTGITYTPIVQGVDWNEWMWTIQEIVLKVGGINTEPIRVCRGGCIGWAYTAYPIIQGPIREIKMINEAIGAVSPDGDPNYFYLSDCDLSKLPDLEIVIEAQHYFVRPEQYVIKEQQGEEQICMSAFASIGDETPVWSMGTSFIGSIYTVLDYEHKRMGFAQMK